MNRLLLIFTLVLKMDDALIQASINGRLDRVTELLKAGADVHARDDYALQVASAYGHIKIVEVLLEAGANIHGGGGCSLTESSRYGHTNIVRILLEYGEDIHSFQDLALRIASLNGHIKIVEYLIHAGADIHARNNGALQWASLCKKYISTEIVKMLLDYGADAKCLPDDATKEMREYIPINPRRVWIGGRDKLKHIIGD